MKKRLDWERMWAPYDEVTYDAAIRHVGEDDVVLDIGAGDLRLARRLARRVCKVYALELNPRVLPMTMPTQSNLHVICADARTASFPDDVTVAVLLMRHCRHFSLYLDKLLKIDCAILITNARWGLGVERIALQAERRAHTAVTIGWYACCCGATGFVPGPPEILTAATVEDVHEVRDCPQCSERTVQPNDGFPQVPARTKSELKNGWDSYRFP